LAKKKPSNKNDLANFARRVEENHPSTVRTSCGFNAKKSIRNNRQILTFSTIFFPGGLSMRTGHFGDGHRFLKFFVENIFL